MRLLGKGPEMDLWALDMTLGILTGSSAITNPTQSESNTPPWPLTSPLFCYLLFCFHCPNMPIFSTATLGSVSGVSFLSHIFTSDASYTPPQFPSLVNHCHKSPAKRYSFHAAKVSVSGNANTEVSEQFSAAQLSDDSSALPEAVRQARVCLFITIMNAIVPLRLSLCLWMAKSLCMSGALQIPCGAFWKIIYVPLYDEPRWRTMTFAPATSVILLICSYLRFTCNIVISILWHSTMTPSSCLACVRGKQAGGGMDPPTSLIIIEQHE